MICARENELLDALGRGFVGDELEAHAAGCEACRELRDVAGALLDDRAQTIAEAPVPGAGTMWWRMQLRHRQEAQAVARRSLLIGQAVTLVIAVSAAIAIFGSFFASEVQSAIASLPALASMPLGIPLLLLLAVWALLAPIGGYLAIRQK
ncbi:MAG TPA: hypothetical protein VFO89_09390 [Thermoanaerobaculia bacterium]|nr:hypothetical protein [Thermoanaerobaculia bacterium]